MTKSNKIYKILGFSILALLFLCLPLLSLGKSCLTGADSLSQASVPNSSAAVKVEAKNRSGGKLNEQPSSLTTFGEEKLQTFAWKDIGYFEITIDKAHINETPTEEKYDYKFIMLYLNKRPSQDSDFSGDASTMNPNEENNVVFTGEVDSAEDKSGLDTINFKYYVDEHDDDVSKNLGWGVYRFAFVINLPSGTPFYYSSLFYVEPSTVPANEVEPINITKTEIAPDISGFSTRWEFKIENTSDEYKYMDTQLIRWFVKGETTDKQLWAYHKDDIGTEEFPEKDYKHWLYEATEDRAIGSKTFIFNPNGHAGTWTVYCVIYKETPDRTDIDNIEKIINTLDIEGAHYTVESGGEINRDYVIYIIIACGVVLLLAIVLVIIKSVKREKVW